jgi:ABC-2 type transport system ATP-binding protein
LKNAFQNLFTKRFEIVDAVRSISFDLEEGEIVGFIGPNGAGKTTTLKMLSGILYPSSGSVRVIGFIPSKRNPQFLRQISLVLGNKSQLNWDIPVADSLYVLKEIYRINNRDYEYRLDEFKDILDIEELLKKPSRNLSLGERAKCEIAAALLHQPRVLYLDEPTLGLDVSMQLVVRNFLRNYRRKHRTTILLTSHYMEDISSLCNRVLLIDQGELSFDGSLSDLTAGVAPYKLIKLTFREDLAENAHVLTRLCTPDGADLLEIDGPNAEIRVIESMAASIAGKCFALPAEITIERPPIEAIIDQLYQSGRQKTQTNHIGGNND